MSEGTARNRTRGTKPPKDPSTTGAIDTAGAGTRERPLWMGVSGPFAVGFFLTLGALTAILLGTALTNLSTVLIYVAFALFAALALDPLVRFLGRRGVKRTWGIVIVFAAFAAVLASVLWLVIPTVVRQIAQFIDDVPQIATDVATSDAVRWLENSFGDSLGDIIDEVQTFFTNPANLASIGGGLLKVGVDVATGISGAVIILVLSLYFLASLPRMKNSFVRLTPARNRRGVAELTEQITDSVGGYLMGMVVLAFFNAVVAFLLYFFLGLPFPALMAVFAFCITLVPLVGSVIFWITGSLLALFTDPSAAIVFAIVYLLYMQAEAYILTPRVMNRTISIPGSLVVIGALVGGTLLGLLGALVAIPVTASLLLILKRVVIPRQDAKK